MSDERNLLVRSKGTPMIARREFQTYLLGMAVCFVIALGALMPSRATAENPFGSVDGSAPPPPPPPGATDFQPEDDFPQANGGDNLGFGGPPKNGNSTPTPSASNSNRNSAPRVTPAAPKRNPPPISNNRSSIAANTNGDASTSGAGKSDQPKTPKLADYSSLDPSVRGPRSEKLRPAGQRNQGCRHTHQ